MRTQDEIVTQYKARQREDPFGFETNEYLNSLDFAHAKGLLREGLTEEEFCEHNGYRFKTDEDVKKDMVEYFDFAYEKIANQRGISANRSIGHYVAWLWLLGDDQTLEWVKSQYKNNYHSYGKHIIDGIAEKYRVKKEARANALLP